MNYLDLLQNPYARLAAAFAVGAVVGVTLLPTKRTVSETETSLRSELQTEKESHQKEVASLKEEITATISEHETKEMVMKATLDTLNAQVNDLKKNSSSSHLKIVKPDGTVVEKDIASSSEETTQTITQQVKQEYDQQLKQVEEKYAQIHAQRVSEIKKSFDAKETEYKKQIEELKSKTVTVTNEKNLGVEAGYNTSREYFGHLTYDAFSPGFLGLHIQQEKEQAAPSFGLGAGVRF